MMHVLHDDLITWQGFQITSPLWEDSTSHSTGAFPSWRDGYVKTEMELRAKLLQVKGICILGAIHHFADD